VERGAVNCLRAGKGPFPGASGDSAVRSGRGEKAPGA
jgi:hypothetical protein